MFVVETTWQVKRSAHSWLTCLSLSRDVALQKIDAITDPRATHRLFEVAQNSFPVFFVSGYEHVSVSELRTRLKLVLPGDSEQMLFNVYRFSGEYRWSDPDPLYETSEHWHITPAFMKSLTDPDKWLFE